MIVIICIYPFVHNSFPQILQYDIMLCHHGFLSRCYINKISLIVLFHNHDCRFNNFLTRQNKFMPSDSITKEVAVTCVYMFT